MSSSSTILGIQTTVPTTTTTTSRPLLLSKTHFHFLTNKHNLNSLRIRNSSSSSRSAVAIPNSVLSEEAFKGLGGDVFAKDAFGGDSESEEGEFEGDVSLSNNGNGGVVSEDELEVSRLGLPSKLVDSLAKRSITKLFPIQRAVLVPAMEGRDIIARAKTGTGKTLAFGIPILKRITEQHEQSVPRRARLPKVLVLAPTRELAKQVEKEMKESAPYLNTVCVYGGVSYNIQQSALSRGVDVVVGTPGRIMDLIEGRTLKLGEVEFLVLDEADQMLAVGFEEAVETILEQLPTQRQSMLFSATMPGWVKKLAKKYLDNPLTIDLVGDEEEKLASGIKLYAIPATATSKRTMLSDLITVYAKGGKTIVFTQTKRDADEVSLALTNSITSEALHGDISQNQRERTLNGFRQGKFLVLVATDVASRGLDIPNVDLVIHYEVPNDSETFVHRSGRTGRAGKDGRAILLFTNNQRRTVRSIERDVGCRFEFASAPSIEDVLESSADQVVSSLGGVHPESIAYFTATAEKLLEQRGTEALAAALAQLSGFAQPPSARSLLTHEQGWVSLQMIRDSGSRGYLSARSVMGFLADVYSAAADEIGKIQLIADETVQGAVFDLPQEIAKELLSRELPAGNTLTRITKLPALQDDAPSSDNYGRFSGRDRGSRGGYRGSRSSGFSDRGSRSSGFSDRGSRTPGFGDRGSRTSGFSDRGSRTSGFSDRGSGGWKKSQDSGFGDDNDDMFKSGGRGRGSQSGFRSSSTPRNSSIDDWLIGGSASGRPSSAGSRDRSSGGFGPFGGACFNCGRSGHRASDCPSGKSY